MIVAVIPAGVDETMRGFDARKTLKLPMEIHDLDGMTLLERVVVLPSRRGSGQLADSLASYSFLED
ncbi:MAG TPA: hypothetical protein VLS27_08350 [Gammaproteobacteria bacterium]|nr:hypothetical protein [Gammaproteobacteria bacterium]